MTCALCQRVIQTEAIADPQAVQTNHFRPEKRERSPTIPLYRPCHNHVHASFTNEELRADYDTGETLRAAERRQGYLSWIRGSDTLAVQMKMSTHVRKRRE